MTYNREGNKIFAEERIDLISVKHDIPYCRNERERQLANRIRNLSESDCSIILRTLREKYLENDETRG